MFNIPQRRPGTSNLKNHNSINQVIHPPRRTPPNLLLHILLACFLGTTATQAQLLVAHRGASADAPENTLAAFREAWAQKADAVEGDFHLTADGHIVCIHDRTTKRTAVSKKDLVVAKSTLAQLQTLDVGNGEKIPTLEQVIRAIAPAKRLFLEVKCGPEIVPALIAQLKKTPWITPAQIDIISFNAEVIRQCRKHLPAIRAHWLTSYDKKGKPTPEKILATLKEINATGLDSNANPTHLTPALIKQLRAAKYQIHCWTVNDPALARKCIQLGVDSITTDRPGHLRRALWPKAKPTKKRQLTPAN